MSNILVHHKIGPKAQASRCAIKLNDVSWAQRYVKLAETFLDFIHLAAERVWLRHLVNAP